MPSENTSLHHTLSHHPHTHLKPDEPSNHLDRTTLEVLTKALRDFTGTTMVISHDRQFLEQLQPTHVITVRGGKVIESLVLVLVVVVEQLYPTHVIAAEMTPRA